jgi:hypothetical protein
VWEGLRLIYPGHPFASLSREDAFAGYRAHVADADTPEEAAVVLLGGLVGAWCADKRATTPAAPMGATHVAELGGLIRAAAIEHDLLPPRAVRLLDARGRYTAAMDDAGRDPDRRRILFELAHAPGERLELEDLYQACKEHGSDKYDELRAAGASVQIWRRDEFGEACNDLEREGLAVPVDGDGEFLVELCEAGRDVLNAERELPPLFPDIDA